MHETQMGGLSRTLFIPPRLGKKVMRRNIPRFDGYGPTSCSLIAFFAELFQLFARKRSYPQTESRLFKGEHYMKTTPTETQALVRQDAEPNRPTHTADAFHSRVPETSMRDDVAKFAYALWQQRGCSQGTANEDWLEAERNLRESSEHLSVDPIVAAYRTLLIYDSVGSAHAPC
jgi:hypothetical protein